MADMNLEKWAYLYLDVSWIITVGWATIIVVSMTIIDMYFPRDSELHRFLFYLIPITIIGTIAEATVVKLGIRGYPPAVQEVLSGYTLLNTAPIEALYYIPVFMALVIAFARYWEISFSEIVNKVEESIGIKKTEVSTIPKPVETATPINKKSKSRKRK